MISSKKTPTILIRKARFIEPIFTFCAEAKKKYLKENGREEATESDIRNHRTLWRRYEKILLEELHSVTGLFFQNKAIEVLASEHIEKSICQPLIIKNSESSEEFALELLTELVKLLLRENSSIAELKGSKIFPKESSVVRNNAIVFSVLKHLILVVTEDAHVQKTLKNKLANEGGVDMFLALKLEEERGYTNILSSFRNAKKIKELKHHLFLFVKFLRQLWNKTPVIEFVNAKELNPYFTYYCQTNEKLSARGWNDWIPPSTEEIQSRISIIQNTWRKHEKKILRALERPTGLRFSNPVIVAHVVSGNSRPISSPFIVKSGLTEKEIFTTITHELIHILFQNNSNTLHQTFFEEMFPNEEKLTQNHIVVHALLQHVYVDILKNKNLLLENITASRRHSTDEYARAWEIVEKQGYVNILKQFKQKRDSILSKREKSL